MKAITLWRPWARYVATGEKRIENRPWAPPESMLGETIAIHAGRAWDDEETIRFIDGVIGRSSAADTHHEGILGTARIAGWFDLLEGERASNPVTVHMIGARLDAQRKSRGPGYDTDVFQMTEIDFRWCFGPVCWVLRDFKPFVEPIPCRGFQKFWDVNRGLKGARLEDFQRAIAA